MKIDRTKALKSSFLSIEKDMGLIMQEMLKNERLKKLLFYTSADALEPDKARLTPEESLSLIGTSIKNIPNIITIITANVDNIDARNPFPPANAPAINIVAIVIKNGNLPLHGMNEFVNIAINLSLLLSIILLPTIAQALHPKPEHIVNACFPWQPEHLNTLSKLNASLGNIPLSSA